MKGRRETNSKDSSNKKAVINHKEGLLPSKGSNRHLYKNKILKTVLNHSQDHSQGLRREGRQICRRKITMQNNFKDWACYPSSSINACMRRFGKATIF